MMCLIFPAFVRGRGALGLLVLRVVSGLAFMYHGWYKFQSPGGPTGWMGPEGPPGFIQALAVLSEFGGGLALILGLLTPLAALLIAGTMVVALRMVHLPAGHAFVASKPGEPSFEPAAGYLAIMILFLLIGPGVFSVDAFLFRKRGVDAPVRTT